MRTMDTGQESSETTLAPAEASNNRLDCLRVLIVDDSRDTSFPLQKLLELDGHEAKVADDGRSAVEIARQFKPQLVLCDLTLPGGMSGYDVARILRGDARLSSAFLVAVTGSSGERVQEDSARAGFERHLTKPIGQSELRSLAAAARQKRG
jgi:CheY-like chemotaxis protein